MKVNVLVVLIILPMLASLGLYCYSFISTRWSRLDENILLQAESSNYKRRLQENSNVLSGKFQIQNVRHAFRSRYGLFGYCLDYKWLDLFAIKSQSNIQNEATTCRQCDYPQEPCLTPKCCVCDNIPDCPDYKDERNCVRTHNQTRYYWADGQCMWQSTWIGFHEIPRYSSKISSSPRALHRYTKSLRYIIMFLLFVAAPALTLLALVTVFCANCVERFYSIPFAFVSFLSLASFLSGCGGIGIFLYEWIQERIHRPYYTYESDQSDALIVALNPWLVDVERLGIAFWIAVGAVGATLFTTLLSCCLCCGLQSENSKMRFHVEKDTYTIVEPGLYDQ